MWREMDMKFIEDNAEKLYDALLELLDVNALYISNEYRFKDLEGFFCLTVMGYPNTVPVHLKKAVDNDGLPFYTYTYVTFHGGNVKLSTLPCFSRCSIDKTASVLKCSPLEIKTDILKAVLPAPKVVFDTYMRGIFIPDPHVLLVQHDLHCVK